MTLNANIAESNKLMRVKRSFCPSLFIFKMFYQYMYIPLKKYLYNPSRLHHILNDNFVVSKCTITSPITH